MNSFGDYVQQFILGVLATLTFGVTSCSLVGCTNPNATPTQVASQKEQLDSQIDAVKELGVQGYFYGKVEDPNFYAKQEFGVSGAEFVVIGELSPRPVTPEPGTEPVVGPVRQPVDESPGKVHYPTIVVDENGNETIQKENK